MPKWFINLKLRQKILFALLSQTLGTLGLIAVVLVTSRSASQPGISLGLLIAVLGLALSWWAGWYLINNSSRALGFFIQHMDRIASGNLTVIPKENPAMDEFGQLSRSIHKVVVNQRALLQEIHDGVSRLASGSVQLSASAEEMAVTTAEIAQNTESQHETSGRMSASVLELSTSIESNNQAAKDNILRLESTLEATRRGDLAGEEAQKAMQHITETASAINKAISVIQEIAHQTNLLSLNAAIEAAKAGQQGKGFAVVAEEVRKLAERSSTSAKEIAGYIEEAQSAVSVGGTKVLDTVKALHRIREDLDVFAQSVRTTASSTAEQAAAGTQVARQVEQSVQESSSIASASTQMSSTTHEIARTASDLARLADQLKGHTSSFQI